MLENGWGTNRKLVVVQTDMIFSYKIGWKEIDLDIQLINRLYWVSQLYPRTREQKESSGVT